MNVGGLTASRRWARFYAAFDAQYVLRFHVHTHSVAE